VSTRKRPRIAAVVGLALVFAAGIAATGASASAAPSSTPAVAGGAGVAAEDVCADSVRITSGEVDAGLGHRGVVITLENCGDQPYSVNGYPELAVLGANRQPLDVAVEHGSGYFAIDPGPSPVTLAPGESVMAVVMWSNLVTEWEVPPPGSYLVAAPAPGAPTTTLPMRIDNGTTGKVTVTAWAVELPE
jgi:hypothetical protein